MSTNKIWLSSPTMHGDEQKWVDEAIRTRSAPMAHSHLTFYKSSVKSPCGATDKRSALALSLTPGQSAEVWGQMGSTLS